MPRLTRRHLVVVRLIFTALGPRLFGSCLGLRKCGSCGRSGFFCRSLLLRSGSLLFQLGSQHTRCSLTICANDDANNADGTAHEVDKLGVAFYMYMSSKGKTVPLLLQQCRKRHLPPPHLVLHLMPPRQPHRRRPCSCHWWMSHLSGRLLRPPSASSSLRPWQRGPRLPQTCRPRLPPPCALCPAPQRWHPAPLAPSSSAPARQPGKRADAIQSSR